MNRIKFYNRLQTHYAKLNLTEERSAEFKRFFGLNECDPGLLTEAEKKSKTDYANYLIANQDVRNEYNLFHLLRTYNTKWRSIKPEDLANFYYKGAPLIKEILEGKG